MKWPDGKTTWLLVILAVAAAARINPWTDQVCFWNDEAFSWAVARAQLADVIAMSAEDTHPPAHYLLLHFWIRAFGDSLFSMRLPSALFSLATVAVVYAVARRGFSFPEHQAAHVAVLAAALAAVSPACASTAYMARMYGMLMFGTVASSLACLWILRHGKPWAWATWCATAALMLYTHNYGLFVVGGQLVWLAFLPLVRREFRQRAYIGWFAAASLLVACAYLPWLPAAMSQARLVSGGYWIPPLDWGALAGFGLQIFAEPISVLTWGRLGLGIAWAVALAMGLFVVIPWFGAPVEWLLLAIVAAHAAGIAISSLLLQQSVFEVRYLMHLVPLALVSLASRVQVAGPRARWIIGAVLIGVLGATGVAALLQRGQPVEAVRDAARLLSERSTPSDVVVADAQCYFRLQYYLEHLRAECQLLVFAPQLAESHQRMVTYAPALKRAPVIMSLDGLAASRVWTVASIRSRLFLVNPPGYRQAETYVFRDRGCADAHDVVVNLWLRGDEPLQDTRQAGRGETLGARKHQALRRGTKGSVDSEGG